jgi:hypothetical protein
VNTPERIQARTASYRATSWCLSIQILIRIPNTPEECWNEEGSLLWGLYRTVPTLIVYKVRYSARISKVGWSCKKKWKKWLSQFRPRRPKHDLTNSCAKHAQTLIELADIYCGLSPEMASDLAQWLLRSSRKTHEEGSSSWGILILRRKVNFCSSARITTEL